MANSSIIRNAKNKIIKELIQSNEIILAIDSKNVGYKQTEKLIGKHIFDYGQNPLTLQEQGTFITVQVHIPEPYYRAKSANFLNPRIEIWIVSHERHMKVDNIPKITSNRNDYISELIDTLLNGRDDFGVGTLKLLVNTEGAFQQKYLYRTMIFEGIDVNNSLCNDV